MAEHNKLLIALMIITTIVKIITYAVNGNISSDMFNNTTDTKYATDIIPADWTISIWGFIYAWQVAWLLFALIHIFRKTVDGPAYANPIILTPIFYIAYIFNMVSNIAWVFLYRNDYIILAFVAYILLCALLYICLFIVYKNLYQNGTLLQKQGRNVEIWMHRLLVHNGLGIYASWATIATVVNAVVVMMYGASPGVERVQAGTVGLGIFSAGLGMFFVSDLFFLDKYSRYTLTPYMMICIALGGSVDKHWDETKTNSIFTAVLLAIACICAVVKVLLMIYRHIHKPLYPRTEIAPTIPDTKV
ncbi:uncharacterized protein LOC126821299 [Patella vulgata]|uniref:uncharacterized protein LOC126821299 n=1 Tax=Patella vulgata TaxID=6465 RepID=UPI00218034DF|nr:uncharacterized protein LOC126821299 [Patella vulgata]